MPQSNFLERGSPPPLMPTLEGFERMEEASYQRFCDKAHRWCWEDCTVVGEIENMAPMQSYRTSATPECGFDLESRLEQRNDRGTQSSFFQSMIKLATRPDLTSTAILIHCDGEPINEPAWRTGRSMRCAVRLNGIWIDLIPAVYLPLDDDVASMNLIMNGSSVAKWHKGSLGWVLAGKDEPELERALAKVREIPDSPLHLTTEIRKSVGLLERELYALRQKAISNAPYNRQSVIEWKGRRFQRCVLASPCIPMTAMLQTTADGIYLEFDRAEVECFVETVLLQHSVRNSLMADGAYFKLTGNDCCQIVRRGRCSVIPNHQPLTREQRLEMSLLNSSNRENILGDSLAIQIDRRSPHKVSSISV